jgi:hypothetical protein
MPMMTYLAIHKPEFEPWQVYTIIAVAIISVLVLIIGICKTRKW